MGPGLLFGHHCSLSKVILLMQVVLVYQFKSGESQEPHVLASNSMACELTCEVVCLHSPAQWHDTRGAFAAVTYNSRRLCRLTLPLIGLSYSSQTTQK